MNAGVYESIYLDGPRTQDDGRRVAAGDAPFGDRVWEEIDQAVVKAALAVARQEDQLVFDGFPSLTTVDLLSKPGARSVKLRPWSQPGDAVTELDRAGSPGPHSLALTPASYNHLSNCTPQRVDGIGARPPDRDRPRRQGAVHPRRRCADRHQRTLREHRPGPGYGDEFHRAGTGPVRVRGHREPGAVGSSAGGNLCPPVAWASRPWTFETRARCPCCVARTGPTCCALGRGRRRGRAARTCSATSCT